MTVTIDPATAVGELVLAQPGRARLFEALRIDYCCGGRDTLEHACAQRGLEVDAIVSAISAFDARAPRVAAPGHDVARMSLVELCDHIVDAHHEPARRELARIAELFSTIVRVHAAQRPEVRVSERVFLRMRAELESHMALEEETLFPACRAVALEPGAEIDEALLAAHERDHAAVGRALATLRELSGGYDGRALLCRTHGVLVDALQSFEHETHQHVHEENNVLFTRVRERGVA